MSRYRLVKSWSRAEWERLPAEARPRDAVPFGYGWVQLAEEPPVGFSGTMAELPTLESARGPGHDDAYQRNSERA